MDLKNKKALVTGAGGGIGWGICKELARMGAEVIVTDINDESGQETLKDLPSNGQEHIYDHLDVLDISSFDSIIDKYKNIDILVNNAGINTPHDFLTMDQKSWDKVFDTNLKGHYFLSQKVSQRMIDNKIKGKIVFISSIHQDVFQARPHYVSTKAAIARLVKEMAVELAPYYIRVNGVAPGGICVNEKIEDPQKAEGEATVLLGGKNGIPQDVGRAVTFLASDYWSRHITGEVITVSGGQYLKPLVIK